MPVIMPEDACDRWLDPQFDDADELQSLLIPILAKRMKAWPVSTLVNSPRNDTP